MLGYTVLAALVVSLGFALGYYAATIATASALTLARRREAWAREDAERTAATVAAYGADAYEASKACAASDAALHYAEVERDEARAALAEAEARAEAAERDASACRINLAFAVMDARAGVHRETEDRKSVV